MQNLGQQKQISAA